MLRNAFRWSGLLLLLCVFVLPSFGADEKKDPKADPKKADPKKKDAKDDDGDEPKKDKKATKKEDDPDALVPIASLTTECRLVKAEGGKLTVTVKRPVREGGRVQFKEMNVDFELADKVMVRVEKPPFAFDDKGQVKKYTKDELDAMKGENKKEFGFHAEIDILKGGHILKLFFGRPKSAPKTDPPQIMKIYVAGNGDLPQ